MKWYKRDPDAWIAGTRSLTLEERGAYNDIIELLMSRDGVLPDDDTFVSRSLGCRPQVWRRIKSRLIAAGKIHQTDGKLTANRVETTLKEAANFGETQKIRAGLRWKSKEKQATDDAKGKMPSTTTTTTTEKKTKKSFSLGTHIDENWLASNGDLAFARQEGLTAEQIAEEEAKFRDYWKARSGAGGRKRDWPATWRNWIRNNKQGPPRRPNGQHTEETWKDKLGRENYEARQQLKSFIARSDDAGESGETGGSASGVLPFPKTPRS